MNRRIFTLSLILIALLGAGQGAAFDFGRGAKGSGDMETRELSLDEFRALEIGGAFEVDVRFGKKQKVAITIDDNLWEHLDARVKGHWLKIDWDRSVRPSDECRIEIVVRDLQELSVRGACDAHIHGFAGARFTYELSGAGNLEMDGKVEFLEIDISGAGDADTRDLEAQHVEVRISGAGNAEVHAERSLEARVSGVGNLTYYGDPEEKDTSVSGMGSIKSR